MIYLAADIHGHIRLEWLKKEMLKFDLQSTDYLILLGDAGIVWSETEHPEVANYYNSLPCNTLFLDGNHENFTLLNLYPISDFNGGKVHFVSNKIVHLMRGEIYLIDGNEIFVFGGGYSVKKQTNTSPVYVWNEEMPSVEEYQNGVENITAVNYSVDYALTHVAPTSIAERIGSVLVPEEKELNDYLDNIQKKIQFKRWYFGHHHKDVKLEKHSALYMRIIRLGEE